MTPNAQAYLKDIEESSLSDKTKKEIAKLLETPTDPATTEKIQALIQADIEEDFKATGVIKADDPEIKKIIAETDEEVKKVENEFNAGVAFLAQEMQKLEDDVAEIAKIDEADQLAQVRASL